MSTQPKIVALSDILDAIKGFIIYFVSQKKLITLLFMLPLMVFGQANKIDTTIYMSNYTSYFSKTHKNPIILTLSPSLICLYS